jgi:PsbP
MKKNLLSGLGFLFAFSLSAQNSSSSAQWITYTDTAYNFTLQHPSDWEFKTPGTTTRFFITSYTESDTDNFRENINCVVRKMQQKNFRLSASEAALKKALSEKYKNFTLIKSGYLQWNKAEALELEYSFSVTRDGSDLQIHILQMISLVKETLFTITYTSEAASYDKYIGIVRKVIASMKVN